MAFDLRYFASTAAGSSTVYPIPAVQARLPSLIIAAENDGDLVYPIADQFIDRANGPTTFATIYGACHNYMGDSNVAEASAQPYITRDVQHALTFNLVVAFIRRWANLDLSLEGLLYNNELAGSSEVGVTAWRNMAESVMIDDHQDATRTSNLLGGLNALSAGTFSNSSIYPVFSGFASLGLKHAILTIDPGVAATYTSEVPPGGANLGSTRRLIFRVGQVSAGTPVGFDWVTVRVRLVDQQNDAATVTLFDRASQNNEWLPDHPGSGSNPFDRFVDASVPQNRFLLANPSLTWSQIQRVELIFEPASGGVSRQLYFDDLRFE
jgi:hypothetical protein